MSHCFLKFHLDIFPSHLRMMKLNCILVSCNWTTDIISHYIYIFSYSYIINILVPWQSSHTNSIFFEIRFVMYKREKEHQFLKLTFAFLDLCNFQFPERWLRPSPQIMKPLKMTDVEAELRELYSDSLQRSNKVILMKFL